MTSHSPSLDLIRTLAIIFVVAGHFFLHTPFNQTPFAEVGNLYPTKTIKNLRGMKIIDDISC